MVTNEPFKVDGNGMILLENVLTVKKAVLVTPERLFLLSLG